MQNIYEIDTAHGTRIVIRKSDGRVTHIPHDQITDVYANLYLYSQESEGGPCFITSDIREVSKISCDGYLGMRTAIRLHRSSGATAESISLADTWRGDFLCAIPLSAGGGVEISRSAVGEWESFFLVEVASPPAVVAERCREILSSLYNIGGTTAKRRLVDLAHWRSKLTGTTSVKTDTITAKMFLTMLSDGQLDADMTDAAGRLMPLDECKLLAAEFDARPELDAALAKANPHDRWATDAMPALSAWLRGGRSPGMPVRTLTTDFDFLGYPAVNGKIGSFPMLINALRRQAVKPKRQACILATARNEGIYFLEWIAHHRAMGFEAFFIYTNDNTDGSDELLELLASEGVINLIHNHLGLGVSPQFKAYDHALQFIPEILDYMWTAAIDIDEFIRINHQKFSSMEDYLSGANFSCADSIGLSWRLCGPNEQIFWKDKNVTDRFPYASEDKNGHLKSIFKTNKFFGAQCHFPYDVKHESIVYKYSNGEIISEGPFYNNLDYENAWVDHFHLKSLEEMTVRRSRNRGDGPVAAEMNAAQLSTGLVSLFLDQYELGVFGDQSRDDALDQRRRVEMEKLMALPGVLSALDRCKSAFRKEASEVKSILSQDPRFQAPGTPEYRLLQLLLSQT
jgi:hypothetical protein